MESVECDCISAPRQRPPLPSSMLPQQLHADNDNNNNSNNSNNNIFAVRFCRSCAPASARDLRLFLTATAENFQFSVYFEQPLRAHRTAAAARDELQQKIAVKNRKRKHFPNKTTQRTEKLKFKKKKQKKFNKNRFIFFLLCKQAIQCCKLSKEINIENCKNIVIFCCCARVC